MLCAVEAHVFEEVSQTTLRLFLLDSAHLLCDVEVGTILRPVVVADVVGQTIVQLANHYVGVSRNGWHLLCLSKSCEEREDCNHQFS